MATTRRGPLLTKGALVGIAADNSRATIVTFGYNPSALTRSLQPRYFGADQASVGQAARFIGPPVQTISLEVKIDAADQLEAGDRTATLYGIHPQLAALESFVYPTTASVDQSSRLAAAGTIEITPIVVPIVLLIWGKNRALPVRVESIQVSEELFDPGLNPIQATVSLQLRVLTYADMDPSTPGYSVYIAYLNALESMAGQASRTALGPFAPASLAALT